MYIRRKVFSSFIDEYGEERFFSTTEFEDERLYGIHEESREKRVKDKKTGKMKTVTEKVLVDSNGNVVNVVSKEGILPESAGKKLVGGTPEPKYTDPTAAQIKSNKAAARKAPKNKNWNQTSEYLEQKAQAEARAAKESQLRGQIKELEGAVKGANARYNRTLEGRAKRAWNGEVGKLGKTGNRALMIGAPIVATGAAIGGSKYLKHRAALADED